MQIEIAKSAGFCEGVERAFRIASETKSAYMLGNLVHNKQVVARFQQAGVKVVQAIKEIPAQAGNIVLISAHGVPPEVYEEAKAKGLTIVDTTCPWVKKAQRIAKELCNKGRRVIIIGDKGHPEVKALVGWSCLKGLVVENAADLVAIQLPCSTPIGLIAQTTQSEEHYNHLLTAAKQIFPDIEAHNTICGATHKRQTAAVELAKRVDLMLVIGDRLSANTKRLFELCAQTGTTTYQIETVAGLEPDWLVGKKMVGLTAGASTPDWVIEEVIGALKQKSE